jgi:hypothetical protein
MNGLMTHRTQRNQVLLRVVSPSTPKVLMMDLKVLKAAAKLAFPSVPAQDF